MKGQAFHYKQCYFLLLGSEDRGTPSFRTVGNFTSRHGITIHGRSGSSAVPLSEPEVSEVIESLDFMCVKFSVEVGHEQDCTNSM
jgi:hypothetical protein